LKLAFALVSIAASSLHAANAKAAAPSELKPWLGCYKVAVQDEAGNTDTHVLELTDALVEHTAGSYLVDATAADDGARNRMSDFSHWWPVSETSIHLQIGDGYTGWSATLESSDTGLSGIGTWGDDTGKRVDGLHIKATKTTCERVAKG